MNVHSDPVTLVFGDAPLLITGSYMNQAHQGRPQSEPTATMSRHIIKKQDDLLDLEVTNIGTVVIESSNGSENVGIFVMLMEVLCIQVRNRFNAQGLAWHEDNNAVEVNVEYGLVVERDGVLPHVKHFRNLPSVLVEVFKGTPNNFNWHYFFDIWEGLFTEAAKVKNTRCICQACRLGAIVCEGLPDDVESPENWSTLNNFGYNFGAGNLHHPDQIVIRYRLVKLNVMPDSVLLEDWTDDGQNDAWDEDVRAPKNQRWLDNYFLRVNKKLENMKSTPSTLVSVVDSFKSQNHFYYSFYVHTNKALSMT